jgi:RND family efflux transporter MFP subunit
MSEADSHARRTVMALVLPAVILLAVAAGLVRKLVGEKRFRLARESEVRASRLKSGPRVRVAVVKRAPAGRALNLLGEAHPYFSTTVYAKVAGYLREVRVDKGDWVRTNEVIGVIESPELEHQYQSAVADAANKKLNAERARTLVSRHMISQQDADTAETEAKVAAANVAYLATLLSYDTLRAPFDGVVTARFADPGALVQNAANSQTGSLPVVTIAQIDQLRVYVYVPQRDAGFIRVGDPAEITLPERPGLRVAAPVARTADELDPKTRTLLTEIDVSNRRRLILPGSFVQVSLGVRSPGPLWVPAEALVVRGDRRLVAVVEHDNRVRLKAVTVGDDDGENVTILSGLRGGERIALDVGDTLADGDPVQPVENP